mmetsp:Transcript_30304/g.63295  ORF Transcript_30304/g.63295 Transcript_30304/m.63295 type:complete len:87 (+) Transcript_30304:753-1013(+)
MGARWDGIDRLRENDGGSVTEKEKKKKETTTTTMKTSDPFLVFQWREASRHVELRTPAVSDHVRKKGKKMGTVTVVLKEQKNRKKV